MTSEGLRTIMEDGIGKGRAPLHTLYVILRQNSIGNTGVEALCNRWPTSIRNGWIDLGSRWVGRTPHPTLVCADNALVGSEPCRQLSRIANRTYNELCILLTPNRLADTGAGIRHTGMPPPTGCNQDIL